jgi:hypothetical protein
METGLLGRFAPRNGAYPGRGIVGSFHKVRAKYLPLYIAEFQFRYNNRFNDDIFGTAIEGC